MEKGVFLKYLFSMLWATEILHVIELSVLVMAVKYSPPVRISRQWHFAKRYLFAAHSSQISLSQHIDESEELSPAFSSVVFADSDENGSFCHFTLRLSSLLETFSILPPSNCHMR